MIYAAIAAASALSSPIAAEAVKDVPVHTVKQVDGRWALVSPTGLGWWSVATCCLGPGVSWDEFNPENPGYAGHRLFPNSKAWVDDTLAKLKAWNFNSIGGWNDLEVMRKHAGDKRLPFFKVLHLGAYYRAPWDDMFSKGFQDAISKAGKEQIDDLKGDPYLVGYFTDNELGWWDDTLFTHYLAMPAESPGKKRIIAVLKKHYKGSFASLKKDWHTEHDSFDQLVKGGVLKLKPGTGGMQAVNAWTKELATHYYSSVHRVVKRNDPSRLILGDRYPQFWELPVVEASKPYIDVVSTNYGADWLDGSLSRFFLDTLYDLTGKPIIIGEFYMNAMQNNSGNGNTVKAFPIVETQEERAAGTAQNLKELAQRPYVVGAHWFQYYDHPPKGRGDGEDNNMGLVDTLGRPYPLLVDAFAKFDWKSVKPVSPVSASAVPQAVSDPTKGLRYWPRAEGWIKPGQKAAFGDLYLSQDSDALWVGAICSDYIDERLYQGDRIPEEERPSLTLSLTGIASPIVVRFSGKDRKAVVSQKDVTVTEWPGLKHQLVVRVPWHLLGGRPSSISLKADMAQHSRAAAMSWRAELKVPS